MTPRPLPLFLDLVQRMAGQEPDMARRALAGLRAYEQALRPPERQRPELARAGPASLRDCGNAGAPDTLTPVVLVPSLINPAHVLDLAPGNSFAAHLASTGRRVMLVDWGHPGGADAPLDIGGHVTARLLPLLDAIGRPVHLIGYCLGGTMAIAAANLRPVRSLTLLATPWHFTHYGNDARDAMTRVWADSAAISEQLGVMPMESLQTLFWSLDPERTVRKYAALAGLEPGDPQLTAFAAMEDWANDGAPLTCAAASQLLTGFAGDDLPGSGRWEVNGKPMNPLDIGGVPARHFTARADRIAPAETAPHGIDTIACPSGHVGMLTGRQARTGCWEPVVQWLADCDAAVL